MTTKNEKKLSEKVNLLPGEAKMGERISKIREVYCKGRNVDFAQRIGKEPTYTSQICNGIKIPSKPVLEEIIAAFPDLSRSWLYFGEGKMLQSENLESLISSVPKKATLPLIPYDAIAGLPTIDNIGITFAECEQYDVPEFMRKGATYLTRVSGDSMQPTYTSGDLLACAHIRDILFFQWGKTYVLDTSQGILVKRVMPSEKEEFIKLVSDNAEKYPPFDIPRDDIRSISIITGVIRTE